MVWTPRVDVIWTGGYPRTRTAQQATRTIPIVTMADVCRSIMTIETSPSGRAHAFNSRLSSLRKRRSVPLAPSPPITRGAQLRLVAPVRERVVRKRRRVWISGIGSPLYAGPR